MSNLHAASVYFGRNQREHVFAESEAELAKLVEMRANRASDITVIYMGVGALLLIGAFCFGVTYLPAYMPIIMTILLLSFFPGYTKLRAESTNGLKGPRNSSARRNLPPPDTQEGML